MYVDVSFGRIITTSFKLLIYTCKLKDQSIVAKGKEQVCC